MTPHILHLEARWNWIINFSIRPLYLREINQVPTEEEAGWASVPVRTFWRREKFIAQSLCWLGYPSSYLSRRDKL